MACINGAVQLEVAISAETVAEQNSVDAADTGSLLHKTRNVAVVTGEPKEAGFARLLHICTGAQELWFQHIFVVDAVHQKQINVVRLQLFQRLVQT